LIVWKGNDGDVGADGMEVDVWLKLNRIARFTERLTQFHPTLQGKFDKDIGICHHMEIELAKNGTKWNQKLR